MFLKPIFNIDISCSWLCILFICTFLGNHIWNWHSECFIMIIINLVDLTVLSLLLKITFWAHKAKCQILEHVQFLKEMSTVLWGLSGEASHAPCPMSTTLLYACTQLCFLGSTYNSGKSMSFGTEDLDLDPNFAM